MDVHGRTSSAFQTQNFLRTQRLNACAVWLNKTTLYTANQKLSSGLESDQICILSRYSPHQKFFTQQVLIRSFFLHVLFSAKHGKYPFSLKWTRLISDPHFSRYYEPPRELGVHILWTPKWVQWSIPLTPKNYPPKPKFQERIISFKTNFLRVLKITACQA